MTKLFSRLAICCAFALGLSSAASSAGASPFVSTGAIKNIETAGDSNLIKVDHRKRDRWRKYHHHRPWRHYRPRSGFYLEFGTRGYYNPYYLPPPVYARPPVHVRPRYVTPSYRLSSAHVRWCYNRYRSYRAYDNTFQPYNGPRRQCFSPYLR